MKELSNDKKKIRLILKTLAIKTDNSINLDWFKKNRTTTENRVLQEKGE